VARLRAGQSESGAAGPLNSRVVSRTPIGHVGPTGESENAKAIAAMRIQSSHEPYPCVLPQTYLDTLSVEAHELIPATGAVRPAPRQSVVEEPSVALR
jgi:hypothetical protein